MIFANHVFMPHLRGLVIFPAPHLRGHVFLLDPMAGKIVGIFVALAAAQPAHAPAIMRVAQMRGHRAEAALLRVRQCARVYRHAHTLLDLGLSHTAMIACAMGRRASGIPTNSSPAAAASRLLA